MRRLIFALVLLFCTSGGAPAYGKCRVYERALVGVSRDGRYVLVSSTDLSPGPTEFEVMDLARRRMAFETTVWGDVDHDALLQFGPVKFEPVDDPVEGSFDQVQARLEPTCKGRPGEWGQRHALYFYVDDTAFQYAVVRGKYVALAFEAGQTSDCDSLTGPVIFGIDCAATSVAEEKQDQQILAAGTPAKVRQRIASEVYGRKRDPLRALDLLAMLRERVTFARIPRAARLSMVADSLLYASRLGWLGKQRCDPAELARTLVQYDLQKPPKPAPAEARLWKAIDSAQARCLKLPAR